ncbi:MAG: Mitotic exit network component [Peltula sp. TS41687]|nr:MAG: Mitotic exit network component [Peltula sp. TS41687]
MSVPNLLSSLTVKILSAVTSFGLLPFPASSESSRSHRHDVDDDDDECSHDGGPHCSNMKSNNNPFKARNVARGSSSYQLRQFAEATLGSGSLKKAVKLPEGEDLNEWLAVNVVDFYNQINLLYGSITEFCSPQTCPEMKATEEFEYLWQYVDVKKPIRLPAPEYVEHLMAWVQQNIDNEAVFPSKIGVPFPKTFPPLIRSIYRRLFRVYAHIYCHHFHTMIQLGLEPHLNTSFKHYVLFIDEHGLASGSRDYWGPLSDLVENMQRSDY